MTAFGRAAKAGLSNLAKQEKVAMRDIRGEQGHKLSKAENQIQTQA